MVNQDPTQNPENPSLLSEGEEINDSKEGTPLTSTPYVHLRQEAMEVTFVVDVLDKSCGDISAITFNFKVGEGEPARALKVKLKLAVFQMLLTQIPLVILMLLRTDFLQIWSLEL